MLFNLDFFKINEQKKRGKICCLGGAAGDHFQNVTLFLY